MLTIASGYYSICLPESREPQYPWFFMMFSYGSVSKPCTPVVHIKIAGKWMFIPLKMVLIGIDPYPYVLHENW